MSRKERRKMNVAETIECKKYLKKAGRIASTLPKKYRKRNDWKASVRTNRQCRKTLVISL